MSLALGSVTVTSLTLTLLSTRTEEKRPENHPTQRHSNYMFQGTEHLFIACYLADIESHTLH